MRQDITGYHDKDRYGNPDGGVTIGTGITVSWQRGPLGRGHDRKEPNGAFVEGVIQAAINRLEFYNNAGFSCVENTRAIQDLHSALEWLDERTARREKQGDEGTHRGH